MIKARPRRFDIFYITDPVFFITFCTRDRKAIVDLQRVHAAFRSYTEGSEERNIAVGRYQSCLITFICLSKAIPILLSLAGLAA
jgi:hypothetical protein